MSTTAIEPRHHLLLFDWRETGETHWQHRWQTLHGHCRVEQADWTWPKRGDWMARLDDVLLDNHRPVALIAHGLGCNLVAAWASHSQHTARVRYALLVAPLDTDREDLPPNLSTWRARPRAPLPFATLLAISTNDPWCAPDHAARLAADWGSASFDLGACGHIDAAAGLGDWPQGLALLQTLAKPDRVAPD